jgi:hypothetical protein
MFKQHLFAKLVLSSLLGLSLSGCGGGGGDSTTTAPGPGTGGGTGAGSFSVSGSLSGLGLDKLVLALGAETVTLTAHATAWTFPTKVATGAAFNVTVSTPAPWHACTVANGSGTMDKADLNVTTVSCAVAGTASTLAGGDVIAGYVDATGAAAKFGQLRGVAVDSAENVYVSDYSNNVIRKITPAGVVSTFAGNGLHGTVDGAATVARFNGPDGLAMDGAGNLYVADGTSSAIRKISPAGVVSTLSLQTFGPGANDRFANPAGLAVDAAGNVYVADYGVHTIRKITPAGAVSTLAGTGAMGSKDGAGNVATFSSPIGVTVNAAGDVYVAELAGAIRKIAPDGVVSTVAGTDGPGVGLVNGAGATAKFFQPVAVVADARGNVYVADSSNSTVRAISPDNVVMTLAGGVADGGGGYGGNVDGSLKVARFGTLHGIALGKSGSLYVTDWINHAVRKIAP